MAEEIERDGQRVVKPRITEWKFKEDERRLFAGSAQIPNWRLADKARRHLADVNFHFSEQLPSVADVPTEKIDPLVARRSALISASAIVVRAVGSGMAMISCGYVPEAAGPTRRVIEAKLNAQAILDDSSGQYAIRYLQGRPRGMAKLAQKYGGAEDVELMSLVAHADVRGLILLYTGPPKGTGEVKEGIFSLLPFRDEDHAHFLLYAMAYEAVSMSVVMAEIFEVAIEIPPWMSGQLLRSREEIQQRRDAARARRGSGS